MQKKKLDADQLHDLYMDIEDAAFNFIEHEGRGMRQMERAIKLKGYLERFLREA